MLLKTARSDISNVTDGLNEELATKLKKHPQAGSDVDSYGSKLISRFSELPKADQKILRDHLADKIADPVGPS